MNHANRFSTALMRSPILWGLLLTLGFFTILHSGTVARLPYGKDWEGFLVRYCASHPIEYVEIGMGFIGLAALILKAFEVAGQRGLVGQKLLPAATTADPATLEPNALLVRLSELGRQLRETYLYSRLKNALEFVARNDSADELEEHLKYLADVDAGKSHESFGFVRILIWAIPIMGFLGTVVGITVAIGNLSPEALESSLPEVTAGLGVAFDTTALALVWATILMFVQYAVDRNESQLLNQVEIRAQEELAMRFERVGGGSDPQVAAVRRMADTVLKATEQAVIRQTELWQGTIHAAHERWSELTSTSQHQLQASLAGALEHCLHQFAGEIEASSRYASQENHAHWQAVQVSLDRGSETLLTTQRELARQSDALLRIVQATGDVVRLEESLNNNLTVLAGSQNFEETVQSLAAVIHLLTARLGHLPTSASQGRADSRIGNAA
ncbi:MAG: MotA/TolQ/ExbB proton channel family protein [Pirellulales bacterium]